MWPNWAFEQTPIGGASPNRRFDRAAQRCR